MQDVIIRKINQSVMYIDTDDGFLKTISDHFSFFAENYTWNPKVKAGFWDGKIRLLNNRFNTMPVGLLDMLIEFLNENQKTYELVNFEEKIERKVIESDINNFLKTIDLPENFEIRDYQLKAIVDAIYEKRNLTISPTNSGKSLIIYLIMRYLFSRKLGTKVLILVPTINLVFQMFSDFKDYSTRNKWDTEKFCHCIIGGVEKKTNKPVVISTWQSLYDIKDKNYFQQYDVFFNDEVHTAEAKSISSIIERLLNAEYRFGLTGTLKESRCNPLQLIGFFGNINTTTSTKKLIEDGHSSNTKVLAYILEYNENIRKNFWAKIYNIKDKKKRYTTELKLLFNSKKRIFLIYKILEKFKGTNTVILFRNLDHARDVKRLLEQKGFECYFMSASTPPEERERIRKYCEKNIDIVILASYQIFQLGISIKNLHNGIIAAPAKGRIRILQSFGRLLRKSTDGKEGYLIDLIDDLRYNEKTNYCFSHGIERLKHFKEEEIEIIYQKVQI